MKQNEPLDIELYNAKTINNRVLEGNCQYQ